MAETTVESNIPMELSDDEGTLNEDYPVVFLDIETSGFYMGSDILQISAKCGERKFNAYVSPTHYISEKSTEVHGITKSGDDVMVHGQKVDAVPLREAMAQLSKWLDGFDRKCFIAVHNLRFDGPKLHEAILESELETEFATKVEGFVDTLKIVREVTLRKRKGECTLRGLAEWLNIPTANVHDASQDAAILEKIIKRLKITYEALIQAAIGYEELMKKWSVDKMMKWILPSYNPIKDAASLDTRKKLARAEISIKKLKKTYTKSGESGVVKLLGKMENNRPIVSRNKIVVNRIVDWLKNEWIKL